ncbi:MAG: diacylglycerol kinase family protein [Saprospiraceae bacterium]|nr:diacylglycerol kinase family protein [Saprospiraceae bacterium]
MSGVENRIWTIVFNPKAGKNSIAREDILKKALSRQNIPFTWISVVETETLKAMIGESLARGCRRFLSVGGDGTNNTTINQLLASQDLDDLICGILPWGTGNDFAEYHGFSDQTTQLVDCILKEPLKLIPLGRIDFFRENRTHYFTNTLGVGFDAFVVNKLKDTKKSGRFSYMWAIMKGLREYSSRRLAYRIDDSGKASKVFSLHLGLGPTTGGGMKITPHAVSRGERFAYSIVQDSSKLNYMLALPKLLTGNIHHLDFVDSGYLERLEIPEQHVNVVVECDGEICGKAPFYIQMHEHRLKFLDTSPGGSLS